MEIVVEHVFGMDIGRITLVHAEEKLGSGLGLGFGGVKVAPP